MNKKIIPDKTEKRFQPIIMESGYILSPDVDFNLYCKLPKYGQDNDERKVTMLDVSKTLAGNHYTIKYDNDECYDEYGWKDFLYCLKTKTQY